MNVDVREYLRTNPISVHELTLSGDAKDCFLVFRNTAIDYQVVSQRVLFWNLYKSMFGNLLYDTLDAQGFRLNSVGYDKNDILSVSWLNVHLSDDQFKNYIKSWELIPFQDSIEHQLESLETQIRDKINSLKRGAMVNYDGAVELQSSLVNTINNLYSDFRYGNGHIWCYESGSQMEDGLDVGLIEQPLLHSHADTMAEAMTQSFATGRGGSKVIGDFVAGSKVRVAHNDYSIVYGTNLTMMQNPDTESPYTYPLWGQNVVDWRDNERLHNNMPPSLNVFVRYKEKAAQRNAKRKQAEIQSRSGKRMSSAEATYQSFTISGITGEYDVDNVSRHDFLLRMSLDENGQVHLYKQSVQDFLDIFAERGASDLGVYVSTDDGKKLASMSQILRPKLDEDLVNRDKFLGWYNQCLERIEKISSDIDLIKQLLVSLKPVNYPGRIIVSVTDDLESKVIANYGGKHWRRITNFLRGVDNHDPDLGKKFGEEYVCLRESNVPIHTHVDTMTVPATQRGKNTWINRDKGGQDTMIVNSSVDAADGDTAFEVDGVTSTQMEYQISPLEYENRKTITTPHDNMPPYREVYIWECVEATDEELEAVQPMNDVFTLTFNSNGGEPSGIYSRQRKYGEQIGEFPVVNMAGHELYGWFTQLEGGKPVFPWTTVVNDFTYYALWKPKTYTIKFVSDGGTPEVVKRKVTYGQQLKEPPEVKKDGYSLLGWFSESGEEYQYGNTYLETSDTTYTARWELAWNRIAFDCNGGCFGYDTDVLMEISVEHGAQFEITDMVPVREGYTFIGWWTKSAGGHPVTGTQTCRGDYTYYAHWEVEHHQVKFNANGGTPVNKVLSISHGEPIGKLPKTSRLGYTFGNWCDQYGNQVNRNTTIEEDMTLTAQWNAISYRISYDMDVKGAAVPSTAWTEYNRDSFNGQDYYPPEPMCRGYDFVEWTPKFLPSTYMGDWTFYASWTRLTYIIKWDYCSGQGAEEQRYKYYYDEMGVLPDTSRDGCVFLGWFTQPYGGTKILPTTHVTGNATYYAHWEILPYTVTLDVNGGQFVGLDETEQTQQIVKLYGQKIGNLPMVTHTDVWGEDQGNGLIVFDNWYTEKIGGTPIDRNTVVTGNVTYYAHWIGVVNFINVGEVVLDNGVASGFLWTERFLESVQKLDFNNDFEIVINATTGNDVSSNQEIFGLKQGGTETEFGALRGKFMWELLGQGWLEDGAIYQGTNEMLPQTNYYWRVVKTGSEIKCYISQDGTTWTLDFTGTRDYHQSSDWISAFIIGNDIDNHGEYWRGSIDLTKSYVNIYGYKYIFVPDGVTFTVSFDENNGSQGLVSRDFTEVVQLGALPVPEWEGHYFRGWFTEPDGGTWVSENTWVTKSVTYYAHWADTPDTTTLTFVDNVPITVEYNANTEVEITFKEETHDMERNQTVEKGVPSQLDANEFVHPDGYEFLEWNTKWDGTGDSHKDGAIVQIEEPLTLYAQWGITVTWNPDNGEEPFTTKVRVGNPVGILPSDPEKEGFAFTGWYTESGIKVTEQTTPNANATYYACWEAF